MQEMAFQGFKFQKCSGEKCPQAGGDKTSTPSIKSGQIHLWCHVQSCYCIFTFALTFSNDAGLTSEKQIRNTSCNKKKPTINKNCFKTLKTDQLHRHGII
jgi:hypothetical protein